MLPGVILEPDWRMAVSFDHIKKQNINLSLSRLHAEHFTDVMKMTLVARHPNNPECYVVTGDDDLTAVSALLEKLSMDND